MNTLTDILHYLHSERKDQALYEKQGLVLVHPYKVRKCRLECLGIKAMC